MNEAPSVQEARGQKSGVDSFQVAMGELRGWAHTASYILGAMMAWGYTQSQISLWELYALAWLAGAWSTLEYLRGVSQEPGPTAPSEEQATTSISEQPTD